MDLNKIDEHEIISILTDNEWTRNDSVRLFQKQQWYFTDSVQLP